MKTPVLRHSHLLRPPEAAPSCHAATLAETPRGVVCAFFAGSEEGADDVAIWFADDWSGPRPVAWSGHRGACWNPVLFACPSGRLLLFYKTGPDCAHWRGMLMQSKDGGRHWSPAEPLPAGIIGPTKNKPLALADGTLLCPSSTEDDGWRIHMERTRDGGRSWTRTTALNDGRSIGAIQPTVVGHDDGRLQLLCRTRQGRIAESWSKDGGLTWTAVQMTALPNPCSGIDAVSLRDGRIALAYNHTGGQSGAPAPRTPLNLALSADGRHWQAALTLEEAPGEYSYPAMIQSRDGYLHIAYTWQRQCIRHVVLDPVPLVEAPIIDGRWPEGPPSIDAAR